MSGPPPPPPPAPPGGQFTSRQPTPTNPKPPTPTAQPPAPAAKGTTPTRSQSPAKPGTPAAPGTKAPATNTASARGNSPQQGKPAAAPAGAAPSAPSKPGTPIPGGKPPTPARAATPETKPADGKPPGAPAPPGPPGPPGASKPAATTPPSPARGQSPKKPPGGASANPSSPPPTKQPATRSTGEVPAAAGAASTDTAVDPAAPAAPGGPAKKSPAAGKKSPARSATPQKGKEQPQSTAGGGEAPSASGAASPIPDPATPAPQRTPANNTAVTPTPQQQQSSAAAPPPATPFPQEQPSYSRGDTSVGPGVSPILAQQQSQSNLAAAGSRRMMSLRKATNVGPRVNVSVLDRDPRSGLPLIAFPADRQASLAHLGNDILLHFFEDCDRISSKGKPLRRIALVTDQTLFVCEPSGSLSRCVQVSKISQANVATDNSNEIALVVPSEYDIILRFDRRSQRDDMLTVLRAVHKRMVSAELSVWHVKDIRPNQYRMEKPPGFQLQRIPQRSRANLAKALESIDANDRERRMAIVRVQEQLEFEHKQETLDKQQETSVVQAKLDEANARMRLQLEEMEKLRQAYGRIQRRVEEIDAQYGSSGDITATKDLKIRELHDVVDALTASVTKANEERMRIQKLQRAGDFDEKDLDFVESDVPRLRGRSLHHQGLVEVLQRQLMEKQSELADLQARQGDLQKISLDLHKKEEQLRELEQTVVSSSNFKDPSSIYSTAAQSTFEDLLRGGGGGASPGGGSPLASSPSKLFGSPSMLLDDIARKRNLGNNDEVLLARGALSPPKQIFSTDIPEFRVPPDERDFKEDPRTGLRFKDLEGPFIEKFPSLQGAIMYFFAVGTKENKRGQSQKRVLIVTDQVVYQCTTGGAINRTFEIKDVREFIRDRTNQIALVVEGLNEYDLLMRFKDNPDTCQELLEVLQKTSAYNKRSPPLVVKEVEHISASELRLEKPPSWEYVDRRARPRRGLYRALQQLSKTSASERMRANAEQDELKRDLTNRIREELMPEVNVRREREYVKLRQQLITTQTLLQEKQLEARNLMRQIQSHKCSVSGVAVPSTSQELFDTKGMYWIPTDPVVMEAEHEILHIEFSNNFIVTSHPNGYLNVWDVTSADLVRALKVNGHTARVTTFHFEGYQVLSGGHDSSLRMWHVMQPTPQFVVHNAHRGAVTAVQFDASIALSSGTDGVIHVWESSPTSLKHSRTLKAHKSAIVGMKMERGFLASAEWGWIFVWDISKGIVIRTLRDDNGGILCVDLCGNRVITGGTSGVINVWNTSTGESETLDGHADDVLCVSLQGTFAVSSSADGTVRMWDTKQGGVDLGVFHDCFPQEVKCFFYRANRFVVGEGTTIKCWTR